MVTEIGTDGPDNLTGSQGDDLLRGLGGNDVFRATDGNDTIEGGAGDQDRVEYQWAFYPDGVFINNTGVERNGVAPFTADKGLWGIDQLSGIEDIDGSAGADTVYFWYADAAIYTWSGDDRIVASQNDDTSQISILNPGSGNDTINGAPSGDLLSFFYFETALEDAPFRGAEADLATGLATDGWGGTDSFTNIRLLVGNDFGDRFFGNGGNNFFFGNGGNDVIDGRGGNDFLAGDEGADTLNGGDGNDEAFYRDDPSGVRVSLIDGTATDGWQSTDTLISIENLEGSEFDDVLIGDDGVNVLWGRDGDDDLRGGGGNDTLYGGAGDDTLVAGPGSNSLFGGQGAADRAVLDGEIGDYVFEIDAQSGEVRISEKQSAESAPMIAFGVEQFEFADGYAFDGEGYVNAASLGGVIEISIEQLLTFVEMYVAYFDRAPDALGLFYWGTRLADGMGLGEIAQSFFFQEETYALYPELAGRSAIDDPSSLSVDFYTQLVTDTYNKLLERDPDAAGQAFWIKELQSGNVKLGEFVLAIINGAKDFNPKGATPDQIAQAAQDTQTVEEKGQLGYAFAVEGGMNNVDNAADVMGAYDIADRKGSMSAAEALIAEFRAAAEAADSSEIVVQITNLGEDPLAIA